MKTIYTCPHCGGELENQCWCPKCEVEVEDYGTKEVADNDDDITDGYDYD